MIAFTQADFFGFRSPPLKSHPFRQSCVCPAPSSTSPAFHACAKPPLHDLVKGAGDGKELSSSNTWQEVLAPRPLSELRVGGIAVPRHLWNAKLRRSGVFRSVEYRILRLQFRGRDISSTCDISRAERKCTGDVVATIRPIRRLLPKFESLCSWPVTVSVSDASLWSYKRDLAQCLAVTVFTAISTIMFGMFVPNFFSVYFIPSLSMYPTLNVGDAVLVRKMPLSSRPTIHRGDVVFFRPTPRLLELVRESETRDSSSVASPGAQRAIPRVRRRDLFVKRVAAVPGDLISIANDHIVVNGDYISEAASGSIDCDAQQIPAGFLYVLGDDASHSLDSRYWGLLPSDYVVGRPLYRIWPLDRVSGIW